MLFAVMFACLTFGFVGCNGSEDDEDAGRVNPRIIVETEKLEFPLEIYSNYKMPYAGVYYENLDRVDGVEVRMSLQDPFGDYIYEKTLNYEVMEFFFPGSYQLIYSAEGCKDTVVVINVCEVLDTPYNFILNDNTLTWDAVSNAGGYEVTVNGEEAVYTEAASFTSDIFSKEGFYVGITAKGDNKTWMDSPMSRYENRIPLQEGEWASFNNPCYEFDIVQAKPSNLNAAPAEIEYLTEEECDGSTGGALRFLMRSGDYGTGLFCLNLKNTIDKEEDFDGIEIRFKLDSKNYIWSEDETTTRLLLGVPNADERRIERGMYLYESYNDEWQILQLPKSIVSDFHGLDYLQFSLFNMTRSSGTGYLYLDYVRAYKGNLDAPTNVGISGDKLTWDDVANTAEYVISVDKTDNANSALERKLYYAKQSEIALADLGIDPTASTQQYEIKVRSISSVASKGASGWSEKLVKRAELLENEVSLMDNAIYALDVVNPVLNDGKTALTHMWRTEYEQTAGADGGYAIRLAMNAHGTYGTFSAFTVNLTKPLNLENGYDCISLRFKLEDCNYTSLKTLGIQLVGSDTIDQNYKGTLYRQIVKVGEWTEFQISMSDLKAYYETGDTKLTFAFVNTVENKGGKTVYLKVALDHLRYYKTLEAPENVRVESGMLKWDAVDGASGYTVSINGEEVKGVTGNSYDLSALTGSFTFKVRAESNTAGIVASPYGNAASYELLAKEQLASFNTADYTENFIAGNPNITDSSIQTEWRSDRDPVFNAGIGDGGAVNINPRPNAIGASKIFIFTVKLEKAIDLTSNDGIKVKFLVEWYSSNGATDKSYFTLLHATDKTHADYTTEMTATDSVSVEVIQDGTKTNFQTITLTAADLKALGYKDGDTTLTFGIWVPNAVVSGGSACIWFDDVSYYNE